MLNKIKTATFFQIFSSLVLFLFTCISYGQQNEDLLSYASEIKVFDAENAIKISEDILYRTKDRYCDIYEILIEANFILENYGKTIEYIYKVKTEKCSLSSEQYLKLLLLEAEIYHILELRVYEADVLIESKNLIDKISNLDVKIKLNQKLNIYKTRMRLSESNLAPYTIESLGLKNNRYDLTELSFINTLKVYGINSLEVNTIVDFKSIFLNTYPKLEENFKEIYYQNFSLIDAEYYFNQKEYSEAIKILENTLEELGFLKSHGYFGLMVPLFSYPSHPLHLA